MTAAQTASQKLLLGAFAWPEHKAVVCWRQWREGVDIVNLEAESARLLPTVVHGRSKWLAEDPARNIIQGLCRRAWAEHQIGLRSLARIVNSLRSAGISSGVLCGSAAIGRFYAERKSIRPFESPELLIGSHDVDAALGVLSSEGWQLPQTGPADKHYGVWLSQASGERVHLIWQRRWNCEDPARTNSFELPGATVEVLPPEELLAVVLLTPEAGSQLAWQWDALSITTERKLDWRRIETLIDQDELAASRLRELRNEWGITVPGYLMHSARGGFLRQRIRRINRDYRWVTRNDGARPSVTGLAAYCVKRWWRVFIVPGREQ